MKVPFPWVEELSRYLMIWAGFLGSTLAIKRGVHVGLTALVDRQVLWVQTVISIFTYTAMLVLMLVLLKYGWMISFFVRNQHSATLPFTMFWAYLSIPVGALFMAIQLTISLVQKISVFFEKGYGG
jgi:C4-dicarboxylate transporter DctQ subunit